MTRLSHPFRTALALVLGALLAAGCADLNVPDFNNPSIGDLQNNPTRAGVITATQGLFVGARVNIANVQRLHLRAWECLAASPTTSIPATTRFINELLQPGPLDGSSPRFGGTCGRSDTRTSATPESC